MVRLTHAVIGIFQRQRVSFVAYLCFLCWKTLKIFHKVYDDGGRWDAYIELTSNWDYPVEPSNAWRELHFWSRQAFFFLEYIESSCNVSLLSSCICVYVQIVDHNSKHNAYVEVHRNVINDARVTSDERTNRSITETENTFEAIQTSIRNW